MRGKTIRQFLIDGLADGKWATELSNWTAKAIVGTAKTIEPEEALAVLL